MCARSSVCYLWFSRRLNPVSIDKTTNNWGEFFQEAHYSVIINLTKNNNNKKKKNKKKQLISNWTCKRTYFPTCNFPQLATEFLVFCYLFSCSSAYCARNNFKFIWDLLFQIAVKRVEISLKLFYHVSFKLYNFSGEPIVGPEIKMQKLVNEASGSMYLSCPKVF